MSLLEWGEGAVAALLIARSYCLQYPPVPPPSWPWWLVCEGCFPFPDTPALWQREIPSLQRVIPNTRADEKVGTQGLYGGKLKWPIVRIIKQNLTKYDSEKGWRDGEWILPFQSWRPSARIHVACLFPKIKPYNYSASKNSPEAGRSCKCPNCHNHTSVRSKAPSTDTWASQRPFLLWPCRICFLSLLRGRRPQVGKGNETSKCGMEDLE